MTPSHAPRHSRDVASLCGKAVASQAGAGGVLPPDTQRPALIAWMEVLAKRIASKSRSLARGKTKPPCHDGTLSVPA